ncbi:UNVERIFIED_CONTAM: hypothetical protein GTU68_066131 [Idotea baltica]|nr:hypothetical protein [Idotea baltica]
MTYPLIGNYGITPEDVESGGLSLRGFVVRELCEEPSNYRSTQPLAEYLQQSGVIGIEGIDTRALVKRLRINGSITGVLSSTDLDDASLEKTVEWDEALTKLAQPSTLPTYESNDDGPHVVAIDYGMKWNIARHLQQMGCKVTIVPGTASAEEVLSHNPDGVFLSNGPGDPTVLNDAVQTIRDLLGKKPIFGICLGHQLLGLACGGEIFKLKFGHRGANQPVLNKLNGRVEITTQNHGFALQGDTLPNDVEVTHVNLNDQTVEGIRHAQHPAFGVQYHPEAAAGPHDSHYLFGEFLKLMQGQTA